jgi:hypothetical protein
MTLILPILIICLLAFAIYRISFFRLEGLPAWTGVALFGIKLLFGFALWAVYTFYYTDRSTSDIYKFYDDSLYIHQAFGENKHAFIGLMTGSEDSSLTPYTSQMKNWERNFTASTPFNENRFMIRLNALMLFISGGNIHVHTIFFCFFSFIGCILLLKVFQSFLSDDKKKWALLTVLFPSFLFWTSGGLKESLIILGLGLLFYGFLFPASRKAIAIIAFVVGIITLLITKYFLLLCLMPALVAYYLFREKATWKTSLIKYSTILILSLAGLVIIAPLNRKLDFIRMIAKKQKHAIDEAHYMKAGSYSEVPVVEQNIFSITKNLPIGLWNSLLKPYLWQSRNPMMLLSAAENVAILLLIALALIYRRRDTLNYNLFFFMVAAMLPYLCFIGIMTPVLGNLVRYKVVMIPMLIFVAIYIVDSQRLSFLRNTENS